MAGAGSFSTGVPSSSERIVDIVVTAATHPAAGPGQPLTSGVPAAVSFPAGTSSSSSR